MNKSNAPAISELTLEELGSNQPGAARLMTELSPRISHCYHAVAAKNWDLARFMLSCAIKLMHIVVVTPPKYAAQGEA